MAKSRGPSHLGAARSNPAAGRADLPLDVLLGLVLSLERMALAGVEGAIANQLLHGSDNAGQLFARVKRWREGNMRQRWCSAGLMRAEKKFRRVKSYRQIP